MAGIGDPATRYEYNLDRQLERVVRPDGGIVDLTYEPTTERLSEITQPRGTHQFTYWATPPPVGTPRGGLLKTVTSPDTVTVSYTYDGPLLSSQSWSGAVSGRVEHGYDTAFRDSVERVIVGAATDTVGFSYDRDDLLVRAGALSIHRRASDGLADGMSVGVVTGSTSYNSHGEPVELDYSRGGVAYFHQHLERDALGRIERIDETWSGVTTSRRYRYDTAGRLDQVRDGGGAQIRRYEYDGGGVGNGNRTAVYDAADQPVVSASYDAQDRMTSYGVANYRYTAAGEQTLRASALDTLSTSYDLLGNLVSAGYRAVASPPLMPIAVGKSLTYRVDGQNRRVMKLLDGVAVQGWLYRNGLNPVAELDGAGALVNRYVYATQGHVPDLLMRGATAYRVVTDHLGSVRAVVRATDGVEVQRLDYDEWGNLTLDTGAGFQSLGYAGGITDRDTRLVRFGARDYDAETGRWTSKDPIGMAGGTGLYAYVDADPLRLIDPSGLQPCNRGESTTLTPDDDFDIGKFVVGFGDASGIPQWIRSAQRLDDGMYVSSPSYHTGRLVGAIWGWIPAGLEGAAALGGTSAFAWLNKGGRIAGIGPGRMPPRGVGLPGGPGVPRVSLWPRGRGSPYVDLRSRLPLLPPLGSLSRPGTGEGGGCGCP